MIDTELQHFEGLKQAIQSKYLEKHTPSDEKISHWKGIDIIYFQEDLRKIAKANISEKSFYTYFKNNSTKLPRIDILNLLCIYAGYQSWFDFKKKTQDVEKQASQKKSMHGDETSLTTAIVYNNDEIKKTEEVTDTIDNKVVPTTIPKEKEGVEKENEKVETLNPDKAKEIQNKNRKKTILISVISFTFVFLCLLLFQLLTQQPEYRYCFIDKDRNTLIKNNLEIKVIKENESPIYFRVKQGNCFAYSTKDKVLKMEISSPFYKSIIVTRNLMTAPSEETIELEPDEYANALYYYSQSTQDLKRRRQELDHLISDDALIYQIYDNSYYGVETMSKQKYISLVTLPTNALENMEVVGKKVVNGKIVMIKFKIPSPNEENN